MSQPGFYNTNRGRSFPFLDGTVGLRPNGPLTLANLPDATIVDCGFLPGPKSRFVAGRDKVFLAQVTRSGTTFTFAFASDAPGLLGTPLLFTRQVTDLNYLFEDSDTGELGLSLGSDASAGSAAPCEEPLWSGYLVTGPLTDLALLLAGDGSLESAVTLTLVEPALIQNLAGTQVTSLALANDDRTRVDAPEDCPAVIFPFPVGELFVAAECLQGEIVFKAGYNCSLRQSTQANALIFGGVVGSGEGEPCAEVKLFPQEQPPAGSSLLGGGPRCRDVLRAINGLGGPVVNFLADQTGVTITVVPEENKITIDVDMRGLVTCFSDISEQLA